MFDDPDTFNPERYLVSPLGVKKELIESDHDIGRLAELNFGVGRRACPGMQIANNAIVSQKPSYCNA